MTETVRIFINAAGLDVPSGATVLEAVRAWNADEADAVARGTRAVTDSRGLPVSNDDAVYAGAIFRLVAGRSRTADADDER